MGTRDYLYGSMIDRQSDQKYPSWNDGLPNLQTFLTAINLSQPIVQSQYEMVWSRWPRTKFFAKNISIPGLEVASQDINHAGFTFSIPTHVKYSSTEISFELIADKEGYHYYDIRNMVIQTGHPLVAGDAKSDVGTTESFNGFFCDDFIEVWLRNSPDDAVGHHWVIHNFRPTKLGDIELSHEGSGFVKFDVTGIFTHITYDCGEKPNDDQLPQEEDGDDEDPSQKYISMSIQQNTQSEDEQENMLVRSIKHDHEIDSDSFSVTLSDIDPDREIRQHLNPIERIVQHTLPYRFGMYRPSKSAATVDSSIELEDLGPLPDGKASDDPDHKIRRIFS